MSVEAAERALSRQLAVLVRYRFNDLRPGSEEATDAGEWQFVDGMLPGAAEAPTCSQWLNLSISLETLIRLLGCFQGFRWLTRCVSMQDVCPDVLQTTLPAAARSRLRTC